MKLVYTIFISNNRASFHLWGKESLVKHQKVSKYENDCSWNIKRMHLLLFSGGMAKENATVQKKCLQGEKDTTSG